MEDLKDTVQFIRGRNVGNARWRRDDFSLVNSGGEGAKGKLSLSAGGRSVDGLFEKEMRSKAEGQDQLRKIKSLRSRGIPTFSLFKLGYKGHGEREKVIAIMEDRSMGGKRLLVSSNDMDILLRPEYYQTIVRMKPETRDHLVRGAFDIAIEAAKPDDKGVSLALAQPDVTMNALMLDVDPDNPDDVGIIVGDIGKDLAEEVGDLEEITLRNVRAVYYFLKQTIGFFDNIPLDHEAYKYRYCFNEGEWNGIREEGKFFETHILNR